MPFSYQVTTLQVMEVELYSIQIVVFWGKKLNKTDNEREKKLFVPSLLLAANECHGVKYNG